ncbi:alpha/beta hydrolase [Oxalobacteraceae bacterium CAVE-383]|nr:alpha/beta hydrolase [Oxalobacteraceae bacterium CAVE-383]
MLNGYLKLGRGSRKVLVLSGWFGSSADWDGAANALDLDAFTYVFFDYRGYGRSMHIPGAYSFAEATDDALRLIDHLRWDRFSLIGHSMGGMAMQRVMLAAPHRIECMVAISAVPACGARMPAERLANFERAIDDIATREAILNASTGSRLSKAWISHMARLSSDTSLPQAFGAYLKQWTGDDFSALVENNPTPVKVIIGATDPSMTAERMSGTWLAWYPNAELETIANAGHYPMQETPAALASTVQTFLMAHAGKEMQS